jgi:hypothetical protein
MEYEPVIGLENTRPAQNEIQDVVRLRQCIWFATQYQRLPGLPRFPGVLPVANEEPCASPP